MALDDDADPWRPRARGACLEVGLGHGLCQNDARRDPRGMGQDIGHDIELGSASLGRLRDARPNAREAAGTMPERAMDVAERCGVAECARDDAPDGDQHNMVTSTLDCSWRAMADGGC